MNAIEALAAGQAKGGAAAAPGLRDAILALSALGFSEETANKMVGDVVAKNPDMRETDKIIRLALSSK